MTPEFEAELGIRQCAQVLRAACGTDLPTGRGWPDAVALAATLGAPARAVDVACALALLADSGAYAPESGRATDFGRRLVASPDERADEFAAKVVASRPTPPDAGASARGIAGTSPGDWFGFAGRDVVDGAGEGGCSCRSVATGHGEARDPVRLVLVRTVAPGDTIVHGATASCRGMGWTDWMSEAALECLARVLATDMSYLRFRRGESGIEMTTPDLSRCGPLSDRSGDLVARVAEILGSRGRTAG